MYQAINQFHTPPNESIVWRYLDFTKFIDKQAYIKGEITFSHQQLADLTAVLKNNISIDVL